MNNRTLTSLVRWNCSECDKRTASTRKKRKGGLCMECRIERDKNE